MNGASNPAAGPARALRVLFVVDFPYWIAGSLARRIWRYNPWIEPGLISGAGLRYLLDRNGGVFPAPLDVVHFLTPYLATEFGDAFRDVAACVATVHHIDGPATTEPAASADAIMTVCDQWHDALVATGVPAEKCVMIRNAVDTKLFRPADQDERHRLRLRLGVDPHAFCVGFSGKKSSDANGRKGIDTFVAAAQQFVALHPNSAFLVMGPGWQSVAEDFRKKGMALVYAPFILDDDEVADFYRALDVYWVTSRVEGGPVPLLEAMASGAPCLSTPVGAAVEAIEDGVNGRVLPHGDAAAFATATAALAADSARLEAMRPAARRAILELYPQDRTVVPARELYDTALANFGARSRDRLQAAARPPWRDGVMTDLPLNTRRALAALDELNFMNNLLATGADRAARRVALRAIAANPLHLRTWRLAAAAFPMLQQGAKLAGRRLGLLKT